MAIGRPMARSLRTPKWKAFVGQRFIDMRAFLRDIQSGLYFSGRGKWTPKLDRALNFKLINRAVRHVEKARLRGVELVVVSGDAPHLTALPVGILHPLAHPLHRWHD
jgi:hypothetical protein